MGTIIIASANFYEWIVVLLYVAAIFGLTVGETVWLVRNRWAEAARSFCFTFVSNLVGFMVGGTIVFFIMLILLMMTFDKKLSASLGGEATMWILVAGLFSVVPIFLFLSKRLFLTAFRMRAGKPAWLYALVSTVIVIVAGTGLPTVAAYIITKGGSVK